MRALLLLALLSGCATVQPPEQTLILDIEREEPVLIAANGWVPAQTVTKTLLGQASLQLRTSFSITGYGTAKGFTCTAGSGEACLTLQVSGSKIDGPGANDDLVWSGGNIIVGSNNGNIIGNFGLNSQAASTQGMTYSGGDLYLSAFATTNKHVVRGGGTVMMEVGTDGLKISTGTLPTCGDNSPATESEQGTLFTVAGSAGTYTKVCVCEFDGTTYRWSNIKSGTAGTTTTCP